ncbi:MAG: ABC transporter permease [Gemmatimonadetes bacterium]|nr:ABC transporter permease [Gemmatimonadota bacterium]MBT6150015.1 ABC transporter permease [Gemmatimonadota bacterium]MBT7863287.1 ABC transporter permease [Gemmatimonadota bacterium]
MLLTLLVRELSAHLLTYRFALSSGLLFILLVGSAMILGVNYDRRLDAFTEAQLARDQKLAEATDFRTLQWQGMQQEKPPNPLSVFTVGLERELSRSVTIASREEPTLGRSKFSNPLFVLFPAPDFLYIVNIVGSLLAILFAFNAVSGEHEDGTLRLVMSHPVPRHLLLLSKWIGGYLALVLPLLLWTICGLGLASLTTSFTLRGADVAAFAGMLAIAALYLSMFFTLALAISVLTHRSSTSLVVSFLIWVLWVLAIPNVAPIAARALVPVPTAGAIASERSAIRRAAFDGLRQRGRGMDRDQRDALREEAEERQTQQTQSLMADFSRRLQAQVDAGTALARLSPSASYVYATASLAGSGLAQFSAIRVYINRYRADYVDALDRIESDRRRQTQAITDREERDEIMEAPIDPDDLPAFVPPRVPIARIMADGQTDILLLVILNGVFFLAAYVGFLRYDLAS